MTTIPSYFTDFLTEIRPTKAQRDDLRTGHTTLRDRLRRDSGLAGIYVSDFLQGSYRRSTAVRPTNETRADVDIIVVTSLDRTACTPADALRKVKPFLDEHYKGKYRFQGRSIGIEMTYVDLDVVVTSAPSEVDRALLTSESVTSDVSLEEARDWRLVPSWVAPDRRALPGSSALMAKAEREAEWKLAPLWIPDRDAGRWEETHPLEQIRWTREKNARCNGHYVNVVKAIKWWRRVQHPDANHPKGYPLEHIVGVACPDGIVSVAEGVTRTLESIRDNYAAYAAARITPILPDHGVPAHNVLARVSGEDFATFHAQVKAAAERARRALSLEGVAESAWEWRALFGDKFPKPPEDQGGGGGRGPAIAGGFTERKEPTVPSGGRFGQSLGARPDGGGRSGVPIRSPRDVFAFMRPFAEREVGESFWILPLDSQHRLIGAGPTVITRGILNSSLVHPREVFLAAIAASAAALILCHNHPSGDPTPSADDRLVTEQLVGAGRLLDIPVHDHLIIGRGCYTSFAEAGLL